MVKRFVFIIAFSLISYATNLTAFAGGGMYLHEVLGYVISNQNGMVQISGESLTSPGMVGNFFVNIDTAVVYDLLTGFPDTPNAIGEGMAIRVSFDPDYCANTVWLHYGDSNAAALHAAVSDNIYYSNDECIFLTHDSKYRITLSPSTLVIDPYTGLISNHHIRPGHEMFIWVDMVTASCPAQVYPEKVVLVY